MRSISRSGGGSALAVLAATLLFPVLASALVIQVTGPASNPDFEAMKSAAATVRAGWQAPDSGGAGNYAPGRINGFDYKLASGPIIPRAFSPTKNSATYVWSDNTLQFEKGFDFHGGPVRYGKKAEPRAAKTLAKKGLGGPAWSTQFRSASLRSSLLKVSYTLADAGPVTAELYTITGKTLGKWTWDGGAGAYEKSVGLKAPANGGIVFLRWTHGQARSIQRLTVTR